MVREPRTIIITGASSGIGAELARTAAKQGDLPILLARSVSVLEQLQKEFEQSGYSCAIYRLDVTKEEETAAVIQRIQQRFHQIDVLINNAGAGVFAPVESLTAKDVSTMMDVNIIGVFNMTKAVLPQMKERRAGHIINIGSQAGRLATPKASMYAASKHALNGFSNALRLETSSFSIHVSTVNPGPVRTPFLHKADPSGNYEKAVEKFFIDPKKLARQILQLIERPKRELNLPWWMAAASRLHALAPGFIEKLANSQFRKK